MNIQIYTLKRNFDVQKAERFFKERKIPYQLVDLKKHQLGKRELELFARRFGVEQLIDRTPEALSHPICHNDDPAYIIQCLMESPQFLKTPIVRNGEQATLGADEATWKKWVADSAK